MPRSSREHVRVERSLAIRYRLPWSATWKTAQTRDISAGGLSFMVARGLLPTGMKMDVKVAFPIAPFQATARIVRTRASRDGRVVGLQFSRLPSALREDLGRYTAVCAARTA